jgi:hypothetical protein
MRGCLLRARRKRPRCRCAADERDEVPPVLTELHANPHDERGAAPQDIELAAISQRVFQPALTDQRQVTSLPGREKRPVLQRLQRPRRDPGAVAGDAQGEGA